MVRIVVTVIDPFELNTRKDHPKAAVRVQYPLSIILVLTYLPP